MFISLRVPAGRSTASIKQAALVQAHDWNALNNAGAYFDVEINEPMHRNPNDFWLTSLLDIASENFSLPKKFGASSDSTLIHSLPNGVQFGLTLPGQKDTAHTENEFVSIDQFLLDLQVVTELTMRMGLIRSSD